MNEHDVIRKLGFPDKIGGKMMTSKKWTCSKCKEVYESKVEIEPPAPCESCGSIFFEK